MKKKLVRAHIISAFPGTGKTFYKENKKDIRIIDYDVNKYCQSPEFPINYMGEIYEKWTFKIKK